jgi:hypothetical protein
MNYVIAGYTFTFVVLISYGASLAYRLRRARRRARGAK